VLECRATWAGPRSQEVFVQLGLSCACHYANANVPNATFMPGLCCSSGVSLACTMWCIYGLNCATACACLYDTSMLASIIYLWATIRGFSLLATNSLSL
jgi:hypothetical protein